ncbi:MAG: hypothetical protein HY556_11065 [Euryarchaeota archaeon]|nr:hypothetical protein [Euryarchaeota archaeon]
MQLKAKAAALVLMMFSSAFIAMATPALASHRVLYDDVAGQQIGMTGPVNVRDDGLRYTSEPDFETTERWTLGTAVANCIADLDPDTDLNSSKAYGGFCDETAVASDLGKGELFFDVSVHAQDAGPAANAYVGYNYYYRNVIGQSDNVILPGKNGIFAWFGHWDDLNGDYRLDDVCRWETDPSRTATDEFVWRGQSSGENGGTWDVPAPPYKFVMYAWMDPGSYAPFDPPLENAPTIPPLGPTTSTTYDQRLDDRTGEDDMATGCPSNTGWMSERGFYFYNYQTSLLWTLEMATAVNPGGSSGTLNPSASGLLTAPFVDVDVYRSLSPQVEDLSYGLLGAPDAVLDAIFAARDDSCAGFAGASGRDYCRDPVGSACEESENATGLFACSIEVDPVSPVCDAGNDTGYEWCKDAIDEACRFVADNSEDVCNVDAIGPVCFVVAGTAGYDACDDPLLPTRGPVNSFDESQSVASRFVLPAHAHEPNTPFDRYSCASVNVPASCNATYGGTSYSAGGTDGFPVCASDAPNQPRGSCNSYVGYGEGWHAWIDANPVEHYPAFMRPHALPPAVGLFVGGGFTVEDHLFGSYPAGGHGKYNDVSYVVGTEYQWGAYVGQWSDSNEDGWIGASARPDAPYGNATLDPALEGDGYRFEPNNYASGEWKALCALQGRVLDVTFKLRPLNEADSWGAGVIVRWEYLEPGKPTQGDNPGRTYFDLYASGEIVLNSGCPFLGNERAVTTDKVVFLGGNAAGLDFEVITNARILVDTMPSSSDPDMPGRFVEETVTDVDVYSVAG